MQGRATSSEETQLLHTQERRRRHSTSTDLKNRRNSSKAVEIRKVGTLGRIAGLFPGKE